MAARLERHFEDEVVEVLTTGSGWALGAAQDLDLETGINSADLVPFVSATQPDMWERWCKPFPDVDRNFMIVFAAKFMNVVLGRVDANADIFRAILDDPSFADDLQHTYGRDLYDQLHDRRGP